MLEGLSLALALLVPQSTRWFAPDSALTKANCEAPRGLRVPPLTLSDFERQWYARHLAAAKETSLYAQSLGKARRSTLRFTWLPSFHHPVIVRIEWGAGGKARLIAKELSGQGGYDPGTIGRSVNRDLTAAETAGLRALLAKTMLFDLASLNCDRGMDGAEWLFEQADPGRYRFVQRWSPEKGPARIAGDALLKLTGWRFATIY